MNERINKRINQVLCLNLKFTKIKENQVLQLKKKVLIRNE